MRNEGAGEMASIGSSIANNNVKDFLGDERHDLALHVTIAFLNHDQIRNQTTDTTVLVVSQQHFAVVDANNV